MLDFVCLERLWVLWMLSHSLWVHTYNCPVVSEKCWFYDAINHLWPYNLLSSSSSRIPEPCGGRVWYVSFRAGHYSLLFSDTDQHLSSLLCKIVHTIGIQCSLHRHWMFTPQVLDVHTTGIRCSHHRCSVSTPQTFSIHTIGIQCLHHRHSVSTPQAFSSHHRSQDSLSF